MRPILFLLCLTLLAFPGTLSAVCGQSRLADKHVFLALEYAKQGRLKSAHLELDVALRLCPDHAEARARMTELFPGSGRGPVQTSADPVHVLMSLGWAHYRDSRLDEARRIWTQVLQKDPLQAQAKQALAELDAEAFPEDPSLPLRDIVKGEYEAAMKFYRQERYTEAIEHFHKSLGTAPTHATVILYKERAEKKAAAQDRAAAARSFREQAAAAEARGDEAAALAAWEEALRLDPGVPDAVKARDALRSRRRERDLARAAELLRTADQAGADHDWKRAKKLFQECLVLDPDNAGAKQGLARAEQALASSAKTAGMRRRLTEARRAMTDGQYGKARELYAKIVQEDPGSGVAARGLVEADAALKKREAARAAGWDPFNAGKKLFDEGKLEEALSELQAVLQTDPNYDKAQICIKRIKATLKGK